MSVTGYNVNFKELYYIFKQKTSGTNITTGYTSGGIDLSNIFQPYISGIKANPTGYNVGGNDLCNIFENLIGVSVTDYNPFSADITPTSYTYYIFSVSDTLILPSINDVYIFLIGGGGGGGSGLGYEGGGAGGNVITAGPVDLSGNYTITIGSGGLGGPFTGGDFNGANGSHGGTTSMSGLNVSLTASGGGGGGGSAQGSIGAGGTSNSGNGGTHGLTVTNVQGTGNGYGNNGYLYTFQDSTQFKFGGGGGAGGRNSSATTPTGTAGGGGVFGSYGSPSINYTSDTGGCGGTGSGGISTFQGFDFSFNGIVYNTGSGGGGGGNSSSNYYSPGGKGNEGLAIIYYPNYIYPPFTYSGNFDLSYSYVSGYYCVTLTIPTNNGFTQLSATGTFTTLQNLSNVNIVIVGGGGGGGEASIAYDNGGGGGGGGSINQQSALTLTSHVSYNVQIGYGGAGGNSQGTGSPYVTNSNSYGLQGDNTIFDSYQATGGNGGIAGDPDNGGTGGSGGTGGGSGGTGGGNFSSTNGSSGTNITIPNIGSYYFSGGGGGGSYYQQGSSASGGLGGGGAEGFGTTPNNGVDYTGPNNIFYEVNPLNLPSYQPSYFGFLKTGGGGGGGNGNGSTYIPGSCGGSGIVVISFQYP